MGGIVVEEFNIYSDIAERTSGDVYIGIVGPVRTGKSAFIRRLMELFVLPNITSSYKKERIRDTLPQSGSGKIITTVEPKFIPSDEAVQLEIGDNLKIRIRFVDCVGYMVEGATGHIENGKPRKVKTPWFDEEIDFTQAAEIGTRKVITDHSTIGIVVTTDGTIAEIGREGYVEAEDTTIRELKKLKRPFVVVLNSSKPYSQEAAAVKRSIEEKHNVPVFLTDVINMKNEDINNIFEKVLFEFPVREVGIELPEWMLELSGDHWLKKEITGLVKKSMNIINKLNDVISIQEEFLSNENVELVRVGELLPGEGAAELQIVLKPVLFYKILGEIAGLSLKGEGELLKLVKDLSIVKREYSKVEEALRDVRETGYGMVPPQLDELRLEDPEIVKQGNRFGMRLKASAPSLHFIKAKVETEVSPVVGAEKQSEELIKSIMEEFESDPHKIWQSNMFGKSLEELVKEGLQNKLYRMPEDVQQKLQKTLQKIINEGTSGLICIIL